MWTLAAAPSTHLMKKWPIRTSICYICRQDFIDRANGNATMLSKISTSRDMCGTGISVHLAKYEITCFSIGIVSLKTSQKIPLPHNQRDPSSLPNTPGCLLHLDMTTSHSYVVISQHWCTTCTS
ncbi:hypothetical protein BsWGS_17398 [Bradybaena similaris]